MKLSLHLPDLMGTLIRITVDKARPLVFPADALPLGRTLVRKT